MCLVNMRVVVAFVVLLPINCERKDRLAPYSGGGMASSTRASESMGCPREMARIEGDKNDSKAPKPFCIDRTEVTVAVYAACVQADKCTHPEDREGCNFDNASKFNHPINCVTQSEAWLLCLQHGKRLPTLAEWQQAVKLGRGVPKQANSSSLGRICWKKGGTCPVGAIVNGKTDPVAVDLFGNVAEWTATRHSFGSNTYRVVGGAWSTQESAAFAEDAVAFEIAQQVSASIGVRCVRDLE